jgi:DNA-binding transcriptional LysR family regulator
MERYHQLLLMRPLSDLLRPDGLSQLKPRIDKFYPMRATRFVELTAFVAVAERKSFTKAADDLGMSASALSQTIRGLEDSLGVRLLNRTTRSVEVTEAGDQVLERVRPLLTDFAAVVNSVSVSRDKPAGRLRLTVPPPVASFVLPPLLRRFLAEYADIVVDVTVESSLMDIIAERYDAGIRVGSRVARDMIAVRITDELRFMVVASPAYLARHPRPETPEDLSTHNCLRTRFESGTFEPWRFMKEGKVLEVDVEGTLVANKPDPLIRAALDGIGILHVLNGYISPWISSGQLIPLLETWMPPPSDGFFLYYPSRRQNPAALTAFIDFVRADVRRMGRQAQALPAPKPRVARSREKGR